MERVPSVTGTVNLLDILDRVLDKGLVIAGDVRISLANIELLTIRIRLLVCSIDKAEQIGLDWWKFDPNLSYRAGALPSSARARAAGRRVLLPSERVKYGRTGGSLVAAAKKGPLGRKE
jgi:Gas vesicle protein